MEAILTIIGVLILALFSWFALYIIVFTASLAWHKGVQKTQEEENRKLKRLAVEMNQKVEQLSGEITQFLEGVNNQEHPPRVH